MNDAGRFVEAQAQLEASIMRSVTDDLQSPESVARLADHQLAATIELAQRMRRELRERAACAPVLDVADIARHAATLYRTAKGIGESQVRMAAYFARTLDACSRLAEGQTPLGFDARDVEATRVAVRAQGIGTAALTIFAMAYPEQARTIDRASLDYLVVAFSAEGVKGGRWPVVADVWKRCFGTHLSPVSIKNEIARLPRSVAGLG